MTCDSRGAPALDPLVSLGWRLFGRRTPLRFYRRCGARMRRFVETALRGEPVPLRPARRVAGLVYAPSDARRLDAPAVHRPSTGFRPR